MEILQFYIVSSILWLYFFWQFALTKRADVHVKSIETIVEPYQPVVFLYHLEDKDGVSSDWKLPHPHYFRRKEQLKAYTHLVTKKTTYASHQNLRWWKYMVIAYLIGYPFFLLILWLNFIQHFTFMITNTVFILSLIVLYVVLEKTAKKAIFRQGAPIVKGTVVSQNNPKDLDTPYYSKVVFQIDEAEIVTYLEDRQRAPGEEISLKYDKDYPYFIELL